MPNTSTTPKNSLALQPPSPDIEHPLEVHHLSHDLRGPLNSILGFSELMLEGIEGPLNEMQIEDLKAIYESAQNLLLLINNVVDISKLQAQKMGIDFGPVDLANVFENVSLTNFGKQKPEALSIQINSTDKLPLVQGDSARIEQLTLNLIRYAFKLKRSGEIFVVGHAKNATVWIEIRIPDVQIPETQIKQLFQLEVEIDTAGRSDLGPGGLELPLARLLAELQNGRTWVESLDGQGTSIYAELPIH